MRKSTKDSIGIIGQYASMLVVAVGIVVEIVMKAHAGFICIAVGGLLWGAATKIRGK